jgi:hypothetical protein
MPEGASRKGVRTCFRRRLTLMEGREGGRNEGGTNISRVGKSGTSNWSAAPTTADHDWGSVEMTLSGGRPKFEVYPPALPSVTIAVQCRRRRLFSVVIFRQLAI